MRPATAKEDTMNKASLKRQAIAAAEWRVSETANENGLRLVKLYTYDDAGRQKSFYSLQSNATVYVDRNPLAKYSCIAHAEKALQDYI
jgi:hypothetical protein